VSVPTGLHVCLINLDRSPDRLAEFTQINAQLSDFTRFSAVDGQTLDLGVLQGAGLITSDILATYSPGALGCAMSHVALWKRGLASDAMITIAEDDAAFHSQFQRHAADVMAKLPAEWDLILWGWNFDLFASIEMLPGVSPCLAQFEQITSGGIQQFQAQDLRPLMLCRAPVNFTTFAHLPVPMEIERTWPAALAKEILPRCKSTAPQGFTRASKRVWILLSTLLGQVVRSLKENLEDSRSQFIQESLGCDEIGHVEAAAEPAVDRGQQISGLGALVLIAQQPRKANCGAQLEKLSFLLARNLERTLKVCR
jgi:hypothetical protein